MCKWETVNTPIASQRRCGQMRRPFGLQNISSFGHHEPINDIHAVGRKGCLALCDTFDQLPHSLRARTCRTAKQLQYLDIALQTKYYSTMSEEDDKNPLFSTPVKALIFDLMGTCLDWHSTVSPVLQDALSSPDGARPPFNALQWREAFFKEIHARFEAGLPQEDIDETHRRTLLALLHSKGCTMDPDKVGACVEAWHTQKGRCCL